MKTYLVLLRGINVGGKNKIPMAALRNTLEKLGYRNVSTYIASGNVILDSDLPVEKIKNQIEEAIIKNFVVDSELIKVLVLSKQHLKAIIDNKPLGFGEQPQKYHCDAIFVIDIAISKAMLVFDPREGVDTIWPGNGVIYSQRLSSERTKSRLNKIVGTSAYKEMTIRNWNTTTTLLKMLEERGAKR